MFYCDECAADLGWPITMARSRGNCETCKRGGSNNDRRSADLPIPTPEQHARVKARRVARGVA